MQIRNNYDKEVFNGDIGVISSVDAEDRSLTVDFDGRNVEYDISELDELVLAYATTIHKAQGSEYPIVVMPVLMNHFVMLQRNLIYTGITRAKKILVIVGTRKALAYAVRNVTVTKRNTLLKERLKSSLPKAVLPAATAENAHLEEASSPKAGNRQTILPYSKRQQQTGKSRIPREMPSDLPYPQQSGQRVAEPAASYGQSSNDQKMTHEEWLKIDLFARLAKSPFRRTSGRRGWIQSALTRRISFPAGLPRLLFPMMGGRRRCMAIRSSLPSMRPVAAAGGASTNGMGFLQAAS